MYEYEYIHEIRFYNSSIEMCEWRYLINMFISHAIYVIYEQCVHIRIW